MSDPSGTTADRTGALRWLWLSAVIALADQFSKAVIELRLELFERIEVFPVFAVTRLHNTGAAFSFLAGAGGWQRWFFIIIAVAVSALVCVWLKRMPRRGQAWLAGSLALIVGGAVGNVLDRIFRGYVVDFLSFHWDRWYFPAFNVADAAITVGAVILLIDSFYEGRRQKKVI